MAKKTKSVAARGNKAAKKSDTLRVLIVESRFYNDIADALLSGATRVLDEAGAVYEKITVPGALEVPAAIAMALEAQSFDGAVALGCVIQGETYHFEIVADQSARALMDLSVNEKLPLGNGILTVDTKAQALARAGADDSGKGNKGAHAARAALAMIALKRELGA